MRFKKGINGMMGVRMEQCWERDPDPSQVVPEEGSLGWSLPEQMRKDLNTEE